MMNTQRVRNAGNQIGTNLIDPRRLGPEHFPKRVGLIRMATQDQTQAETFLTLLDEADDRFLFASIYPGTEESPAKCIHEWGTVDELFRKLVARNEDGAGIYVVANKSTGAKDSDVTSVRAIFADQDVPSSIANESWPIDPHMIVETSPGRYHYWWLVDGLSREEFSPIQSKIASTYGTDRSVTNLARLMRVPGFLNTKRDENGGERYPDFVVRLTATLNVLPYKPEIVRTAFPPSTAAVKGVDSKLGDDRLLRGLKEAGLYIEDAGYGKHFVTCPWKNTHTVDSGKSETAYFEAHTNGYASAAFRCLHEHCKERSVGELREYLKIEIAEIADHLQVGENSVLLPTAYTSYPESAKMIYSLAQRTSSLYRQGERPARLCIDNETQFASIEQISGQDFPAYIDNLVEGLGGRSEKIVSNIFNELKIVPTRCNTAQATGLLGAYSQIKKLLDPLSLITSSPILCPDGQVLGKGYHRALGGIYINQGGYEADISVGEALDALLEHLVDFQFFKPSDQSRAVAHLLGPAMRQGGFFTYLPADLIEATESQSGKGTLCEATHALYGAVAFNLGQRKGGVGSMEEQIDSAMVAGRPFICLDNYRGKLDSPRFEALLTARPYSWLARVPHRKAFALDPTRFCFHITSNGMHFTPDLLNRVNIIKLRKQPPGYPYRYGSKEGYIDHTFQNRSYLIGCVFSVIQEWIRLGKPTTDATGHNFLSWSQSFDWIVQNLFGLPPLLADMEEYTSLQTSPQLIWLRSVAIQISDIKGSPKWYTASQLGDEIEGSTVGANMLPLGSPGRDIATYREEKQRNQQLGKLLGRIFRGLIEDDHSCSSISVDGFCVTRRSQESPRDPAQTKYDYLFALDNELHSAMLAKALEDSP